MTAPAPRPKTNVFRDFGSGIRLLGSGLRIWGTSPRLMLIGAIPALIVALVYLAGVIALLGNLDAVAGWASAYSRFWGEPLHSAAVLFTAIAILLVAGLFATYTFTAVTLLVGDPFYERIWRSVEEQLGNPPADMQLGFWRSLRRGIADGLRILVPAALLALLVFLLSLIPVVGQILGPVLGALVGGWFLALELTGYAFDARGKTLRERRRALGGRRARTLGFGVATYLLFLVPFAPIFVMPAAVAGAAMLSRRALDEWSGA